MLIGVPKEIKADEYSVGLTPTTIEELTARGHAAAAIAIAAKEELVIIEADGHDADDPRLRTLAADTGLKIKRMAASKVGLPDPATCVQAFRQVQERLVVMTRGALEDGAASVISAARRVPVLVVEPPEVAGETIPLSKITAQNGR